MRRINATKYSRDEGGWYPPIRDEVYDPGYNLWKRTKVGRWDSEYHSLEIDIEERKPE